MDAKHFFTEDQIRLIRTAIEEAEEKSTGEIRVHIENESQDAVKRAVEVFEKLEMHKTELRNGVLFYLSVNDHKFAVIGDKGINDVVPNDFWDSIRDEMVIHFKKGEFTNGLIAGVNHAGDKLISHFPGHHEDLNELSDEITFLEDLK